ncbi:hypothetical protein P0Y35_10205 [Kiritimatiellaeota bacterium B1221]|nr:hypothetical protein [Kiritimatiellaeota bacterium B1221]
MSLKTANSLSNWNRGLRFGLMSGGITFMIIFAWIGFVSTLPAISEVSMSLAVRPWWRLNNWIIAILFSLPIALLFAAGGAKGQNDRK